MIKLAAIADDLTGANDTALQFAKKGLRTRVELSSPSVRVDAQCPAEVIAIDTDSRDAKTSQVYAQVRTLAEKVKALAPLAVYKKMDSTLRGNWVTEAKAIADVLQPELVIVAPAYPQNGRITVGGFCFLDGHPLELTEIAHAPKNPVQSSYLPHLLQAQMPELAVTILRFDKMQQGVEAVRKFLQTQKHANCRWFVADIAEDANFLTLIKAVHGYQNILWVGSAGLAEYLPQFYGWQGHNVPELPTCNAPIVFCAGSVSHTTQKQIRSLRRNCGTELIRIVAEDLLCNRSILDTYAEKVQRIIAKGHDVILASAEDDGDVRRAVQAGRLQRLSGSEVSNAVAQAFAYILSRMDLKIVSGLVLTGGDTAVHVCRAIGASQIEILKEVEAGVPLGVITTAKQERLHIVTKAGAFGSEQVFLHAAQAIRGRIHLQTGQEA